MTWDGSYCVHRSGRCSCTLPKVMDAPVTSRIRLEIPAYGYRDFKIVRPGSHDHERGCMPSYLWYDRRQDPALAIAVQDRETAEERAGGVWEWKQYLLCGVGVWPIETRDFPNVLAGLSKMRLRFTLRAHPESAPFQARALEARGLVAAGSARAWERGEVAASS